MSCPIPSDMICPTPPIFRGETWDVLCGQMAREYHQTQLYFFAVTLLPRQTKAIGGNVEGYCFGVSLRYTPRGEARGGAVRRWGGGGPRGRGGAGAGGWGAVCAGPAGRDDGEAGPGHGCSGRNAPTARQTQQHTFWTHPTGPPSHPPLANIPLSCGTPDLKKYLQNVNERMRYHPCI
jgi:hypothetical protein